MPADIYQTSSYTTVDITVATTKATMRKIETMVRNVVTIKAEQDLP